MVDPLGHAGRLRRCYGDYNTDRYGAENGTAGICTLSSDGYGAFTAAVDFSAETHELFSDTCGNQQFGLYPDVSRDSDFPLEGFHIGVIQIL